LEIASLNSEGIAIPLVGISENRVAMIRDRLIEIALLDTLTCRRSAVLRAGFISSRAIRRRTVSPSLVSAISIVIPDSLTSLH